MSNAARAGNTAQETTVETIGKRLRRSAPAVRALLCSVHDTQGDVLWLSEGFLGPDEHCAVLRACEGFPDPNSPDVIIEDIEDGRCAVVLRASTIARRFVAAVMFLVDTRSNTEKAILAQLQAPAITELLRELAWLQAPKTPGATLSNASIPAHDIGATAIGRVVDLRIPAAQVAPEVDRLCAALRRTEISLYVQRLVPLKHHDGVRRFEVLLRSGGDTRAAPTKMLARATKAGLASMIDRRVFTMLLSWLVKHRQVWQQEPGQFSINLSATALRDKHFCEFLQACISKAQVPRRCFAFEIDEEDCLTNLQATIRFAHAINQLGCVLAVDNFTASTPSLELLKVPGLSAFKFSERLSGSITESAEKQARFKKLISVTKRLGKSTVAKRVNDPALSRALSAYGVDFVQSHSASAPCPMESLMVTRATGR